MLAHNEILLIFINRHITERNHVLLFLDAACVLVRYPDFEVVNINKQTKSPSKTKVEVKERANDARLVNVANIISYLICIKTLKI